MMDPKDVGEWQHEEFYRYVAQAHDKPRYTLHYRTDAPLNIRSVFYVPDTVRPSHGGAAANPGLLLREVRAGLPQGAGSTGPEWGQSSIDIPRINLVTSE